MQNMDKNMFNKKEYYCIMVKNAKCIFLDKEFSCFLYTDIKKAEAFITKLEEASGEQNKYCVEKVFAKDRQSFMSEMYAAGALNIKIIEFNQATTVQIMPDKLQMKYYNNRLNGLMSHLLQTKQKKNLRLIKTCVFLIPVIIEKRNIKEYPIIHYCQGYDEKGQYFVCFTSMEDFCEWNNTQDNKWEVIETNIFKLEHLRQNMPILINPFRHNVILKDKYIKIIRKG